MKRIISLILATLMTVNLLSLSVLAAEDTSDTNTTQYSAVFQFDEPDNEAEMHSVTVIDECVYADLNWLAQKLELKLEINNSGNYLPERNGSSVNPIIRNMIDGYESSFKDAAQEEEYVISKPDVNLLFYLRSGSSTVYSYSEYMGNISADLGGSVQHIPDRNNADADVVWVPMSMFLSIFDSFCWIDGTTIHILPCSLTAVDVLHTPNLDQFFYDPVTNGGIDEWVSNTKRGYAIFYNKVKKLFQGVVSFNPVQVWESLSLSDYSDVSNTLALQLCTPNASELDMLKRVAAETGSTILRDYSTYKSVSDLNSDKSSLDFTSNGIDAIFSILGEISDTVEEGTTIRAVDMFEKLSGNNWDLAFENADEVAAAVKDAVDAGSVADTVTKWANGIDFAGDAFSLAAPIFISYITSAHEISSSLQEYNSAVQNYISEFNVSSDVFMKEEIIDTLDEKSKMYMSQSTSVFDDELAKELKKTTLWSGVSFAGGKIIDNFVDSLWQYKVISLGWDIGEWVANGLSGGAFDSLQALNNSSAALMLEYDSQQVVRQFKDKCKNTEFTNDLLEQYKSLELVRLKSYLITREDVLSYYKFWEKKKPEEYPYAEAEITKDNEAILRCMAALLSANSGLTKKSITGKENRIPTMNKLLLNSGALMIPEQRADREFNKIIQEYTDACAVDSSLWLENPTEYQRQYPHVNPFVIKEYHTPRHYDPWFEADLPCEIRYAFYDIDGNGTKELILAHGLQEPVIFAVYVFNGTEAVELGKVNPEEYGSYSLYSNGVIAVIYGDADYYQLPKDGSSLIQLSLNFAEQEKLLEKQIIISDWISIAPDVPWIPTNTELFPTIKRYAWDYDPVSPNWNEPHDAFVQLLGNPEKEEKDYEDDDYYVLECYWENVSISFGTESIDIYGVKMFTLTGGDYSVCGISIGDDISEIPAKLSEFSNEYGISVSISDYDYSDPNIIILEADDVTDFYIEYENNEVTEIEIAFMVG